MKTKKLIELLQKEDPSGENEVCVGNVDIFFVSAEPAYYDGRLEVLKRDESNPYYNVVGAERKESGTKINIHLHSIFDAISSNPDLPIDYSDLSNPEKYVDADNKIREDTKRMFYELELELFVNHIKNRVDSRKYCSSHIEGKAKTFFNTSRMNHDDPLPKIVTEEENSYVKRREAQWNKEIAVECIDTELYISRR